METEDKSNAESTDESTEDFREEVEQDPSTAGASDTDDSDVDRLRGG